MSAIVLSNVSKQFTADAEALHAVSLTVADGELLALLGASGSGKTTLLRLIAGLETPTAGSIQVGGDAALPGAGYRLNIAMCFQTPALYPHLRVRENLVFGWRLRYNWVGRLIGRREPPGMERQVQEVASLLDMVPLLDREPAGLSGGERQRVALGRALLRQPAVLLLDEPLAHVDGPLRDRLRQALKKWQREKRTTVIWVTHDAVEALAVGDRVGVLHRGKLQQMGSSEDVCLRPATVHVAERTGDPPWNLLAGRLVQQESAIRLANGDAFVDLPHEANERLDAGRNCDLYLGIRPECVELQTLSPQPASLTMAVELVESAGDERWAVLTRGSWRVKCRAPNPAPGIGASVAVRWDWRDARWFDGESGMALPGMPASMEA